MATNRPTFLLSAAAETARNAEYTGTPFTDTGAGTAADPFLGCNKAGSNAPGIGINTGNIDPKLQDWSVLDQAGDARTPQNSEHIAGVNVAITPGTPPTSTPVPIHDAVDPADVNNTMNYLAATQQAADGAIFDVTTGAVNHTGVTVEIGDRLWGVVPVA